MQTEKQIVRKVDLRTTKIATYWRVALYLISAGVFAITLNDFVANRYVEALGNLGLTLIFAGLAFRSCEAAAMAYVKDVRKRNDLLLQMRKNERKNMPWVSLMVRSGWIFMLIGVSLELLSPV